MESIWAFTKLLASVKHPQKLSSIRDLPDYASDYRGAINSLTYEINDLDIEPPEEAGTPTSELLAKMCMQLTQVERQIEDYVAEMHSDIEKFSKSGKPQSVLLDMMWDTQMLATTPLEVILEILEVSFCGAFCPASEKDDPGHWCLEHCPFLHLQIDQPVLVEESEVEEDDYTTCSSEAAVDLSNKEEFSVSENDGYITCCSDADAAIPEVVEEEEYYQTDTECSSVGDYESEESFSGSYVSDATEIIQRLEQVF